MGYGGGDPEKVLALGAAWCIAALDFEAFKADYQKALVEMNREKNA